MLFLIKDLKAHRVNLLMNDYVAGLPSPLAILGFTDALVRAVGQKGWSGRCLPVLHEVYSSYGRTKPEMDRVSANFFSPTEIPEDMTGYVSLSLIADIPGFDDDIALADALCGRRIAGGIIQNREFSVETVPYDGTVFKKVSRGSIIAPYVADGSATVFGGTEEEFAAFSEILFPALRAPNSGWIIPVAAGYRLLEDTATVPKRERTRDASLPHVFAEPLSGAAKLISVRNPALVKLDRDGLSELLWSWTVRDDFILGHSAYLPSTTLKESTND